MPPHTLISAITLLGAASPLLAQGADYNGDGFADLAAGAPGELLFSDPGSGAVITMFGSPAGLQGGQLDFPGQFPLVSAGAIVQGEEFGKVLASGDYNGDGFDDLAVGVETSQSGVFEEGNLYLFEGSPTGLENDAVFGAFGLGTLGAPDPQRRLGSSLASGDINDDGFDDLVVGERTPDDSGRIHVHLGSVFGIQLNPTQTFEQGGPGFTQLLDEAGDQFGFSMTIGDFDGDGFGDLALSRPGEDPVGTPLTDSGAVDVIFGNSTGLDITRTQCFDQDTTGISGFAESGDRFGSVLISGDLNGDGRDELIIGTPNEAIGSATDSGVVQVLLGASGGLTTIGQMFIEPLDFGATSMPGEKFGASIRLVDLFDDGSPELVIGSPGFAGDAGAVWFMVNIAGTLIPVAAPFTGTGLFADHEYGLALSSGDIDGNGAGDLAIGIPGALFGNDEGVIQIISLTLNQFIIQGLPGVTDAVMLEAGDRFGAAF